MLRRRDEGNPERTLWSRLREVVISHCHTARVPRSRREPIALVCGLGYKPQPWCSRKGVGSPGTERRNPAPFPGSDLCGACLLSSSRKHSSACKRSCWFVWFSHLWVFLFICIRSGTSFHSSGCNTSSFFEAWHLILWMDHQICSLHHPPQTPGNPVEIFNTIKSHCKNMFVTKCKYFCRLNLKIYIFIFGFTGSSLLLTGFL